MLSIKDTLKSKCRELQIEKPNKIAKKAAELHRMLDLRCRTGAPINEFSKPYICIDLACRWFKRPFPRSRAVAMSSITAKDYQVSFITAQNLLGLKSEVSVEDLCMHFGVTSPKQVQDIHDILEEYKTKFVESLSEQRRKHVDFSNATFRCVAFFIKCKEHAIQVEKSTLCDRCDVQLTGFDDVLNSFVALLQLEHLFPSESSNSNNKKRKKVQRPTETRRSDVNTMVDSSSTTTSSSSSSLSSSLSPTAKVTERGDHSEHAHVQRATRKRKRNSQQSSEDRDEDDMIAELLTMDSSSPQPPTNMSHGESTSSITSDIRHDHPLQQQQPKRQKTISSYFTKVSGR